MTPAGLMIHYFTVHMNKIKDRIENNLNIMFTYNFKLYRTLKIIFCLSNWINNVVAVHDPVMFNSLGPPRTAAWQSSLSFTITLNLLKLISNKSVMPFKHHIFSCPLSLLSSIFPVSGYFSSECVFLMRWPKYWSFSFSISPPKEYSGLISFKIYWFDLLVIQGTLKSFLQDHGLKAWIFSARPSDGPNHISTHKCWKNHSFDYTHLFQQSDVSAF